MVLAFIVLATCLFGATLAAVSSMIPFRSAQEEAPVHTPTSLHCFPHLDQPSLSALPLILDQPTS